MRTVFDDIHIYIIYIYIYLCQICQASLVKKTANLSNHSDLCAHMSLRDHMHTALKCFGANGHLLSTSLLLHLSSPNTPEAHANFKWCNYTPLFVAVGNLRMFSKVWKTVDMELFSYHHPIQAVPRHAAAEAEDPSRDSPVASWSTWIAPGQNRLRLSI